MRGLKALFPSDPERRERLGRWLGYLAIALAVFMLARALRKEGGVMELNRAFGARFLAGQDPWFDPARGHRVHGPYPPSLAWVAVPLSCLPLLLARGIWAALQVGALVVLYRTLRERARNDFPAAAKHMPMLFALCLLLASRFLLRDFAGGGGNLIYATLAYVGVEFGLRGRPIPAGALLGLSVVLKPNLVLLVLFLGLRRRFGAAASALGFALVLFWLPSLAYGPERYAALARDWVHGVVEYAALEELQTSALVPDGLPIAEDAMNQSLREAVGRLVRPPGDSGAIDVHVLELSPRWASWLARGMSLVLIALAAIVALRARGGRAEWIAMQVFFPLSLLVSPITWKAHHAALLTVFFALCCTAFERAATSRAWIAFLSIYWIACDLLSEDVVGKTAKRALQAVSLVTWFDVALLIALAWLSLRETRATQVDPHRTRAISGD